MTVYSGRPFIDPKGAPAEALLALPAMDVGKVAALIADRGGSTQAGPGGAAAELPVTGRAFTVRAEFQKPGGVTTREVVVRLTDDPMHPYWMLSWKNK